MQKVYRHLFDARQESYRSTLWAPVLGPNVGHELYVSDSTLSSFLRLPFNTYEFYMSI